MISTDTGHSHGDEEAHADDAHDEGIPYEEACEGLGEEPAHEHPEGEEPGHEHPEGEEPGHEHPEGEEPGHEHPEGEEPGHDHGVEATADDHGDDADHDHGDDADHEHGDPREFDEVWAGDGFDLCFFSAGDEVVGCEY